MVDAGDENCSWWEKHRTLRSGLTHIEMIIVSLEIMRTFGHVLVTSRTQTLLRELFKKLEAAGSNGENGLLIDWNGPAKSILDECA